MRSAVEIARLCNRSIGEIVALPCVDGDVGRWETEADLASMEDEALVLHVRLLASEAATRILYERYWPTAYRRASRRYGAQANHPAREALHHALFECVVKPGFDPTRGKRLRPYLQRAIDHHLSTIGRQRRRRLENEMSLEDLQEELTDDDPDLDFMGPCAAAVAALLDEWTTDTNPARGDRRLWAEVLRRRTRGESTADIAAALRLKPEQVSNILSKRIRPAVRSRMGSRTGGSTPLNPADGGLDR